MHVTSWLLFKKALQLSYLINIQIELLKYSHPIVFEKYAETINQSSSTNTGSENVDISCVKNEMDIHQNGYRIYRYE